MIRIFQLIFSGSRTWEKIKEEQSSVAHISLTFLLPLMLVCLGAEYFGLVHWGEERGAFDAVMAIPSELAIKYELVHVAAFVLIVYVGSVVLQKVGATFHRRHTYTECFTTLTYSLSPLILLHIPDAYPAVPTWVCYAIGIFMTLSQFYRGVPTILKPDPSNALGLFIFCSFILIAATGLVHFVATQVLHRG